ncbi:1110_t:CDS:2, partial [Funneliformis geosporum]
MKKQEPKNRQLKPNSKELELLKEGCDEVLAAFEKHFRKELLAYQRKPYNVHYSE